MEIVELDCEYFPEKNRPLTPQEYAKGLAHAKAEFILGHEEQLAVCAACAEKAIKRYRYVAKRRLDNG